MAAMESMPMHPHSGISTVTVITQGHLLFDDPEQGSGTIDYGGVEWMRASGGVWHGKEMSVGPTPANHITGFQLWVALPPHLENGPAVQRHEDCRTCYDCGGQRAKRGPTRLRWVTRLPFLAISKGSVKYGNGKEISKGELVVFEQGEEPLQFVGLEQPQTIKFVLGSAVPHPYPLHLGYYSVHTSAEALKLGERTIKLLGDELGDRKYSTAATPVFRKK